MLGVIVVSSNKVILISVDGMRPDGFLQCGNPFIEEMMKKAYYTLDGRTVLPPSYFAMSHVLVSQCNATETWNYDQCVLSNGTSNKWPV